MKAILQSLWRVVLCGFVINAVIANSAIASGYERKLFIYDMSFKLLTRGDSLEGACALFWGDATKQWVGDYYFVYDKPRVEVLGYNGSPLGSLPFGAIYCPVRVFGKSCPVYLSDGSCQCACTPGGRWEQRALQVIDVFPQVPTEALCPLPASPKFGNPIYPTTGVKREVITTNMSLAGSALLVTYDTQRVPLPDGKNIHDFERNKLRDFGRYWTSSWHRKIIFDTRSGDAAAVRGDGSVQSFVDSAGYWQPAQGMKDSLVEVPGGYLYKDQTALAIESYGEPDQRTGKALLKSISFIDGRTLKPTHSTEATDPSLAPGPGYMLRVDDSFGRSISFTYKVPSAETGPVVGEIVNSDSVKVSAEYDAAGNLTALRWPDEVGKSFIYDSENAGQAWALTGVVAEDNKRISTFTYHPGGWVRSTERAGGVSRYQASYEEAPQLAVRSIDIDPYRRLDCHEWAPPKKAEITQPNGDVVGMNFNLIRGIPLEGEAARCDILRFSGYTQPAGAGCGQASSSADHDSYGNVTRLDNFNGQRSCFAYSEPGDGKLGHLEVARVEGLAGGASGVACSAVLAPGAALPKAPDGTQSRKTSTKWHPDWAIKVQQARPGSLTTWVYNDQPDPLTSSRASCAPSNARLPNGSPIVVLCKEIVQATTDTSGALGFQAALDTTVPARVRQYTYNSVGQVLTVKDELGNTSSYSYYTSASSQNAVGDLESATNALGQVTRYTAYDGAGRLLAMEDPNGVETTFSYDLRGRLLSSSTAGQLTRYDYFLTGLLKQVTQPDGSFLAYEYDDAQRLIAVSDKAGNRIDYTLDNEGNRVTETVKDPTGQVARQLMRVMDALGRTQQLTGRQ